HLNLQCFHHSLFISNRFLLQAKYNLFLIFPSLINSLLLQCVQINFFPLLILSIQYRFHLQLVMYQCIFKKIMSTFLILKKFQIRQLELNYLKIIDYSDYRKGL
ncbi:hypothetical protein IMG5_062780, partial [Ichthyophthirius multifiliis]